MPSFIHEFANISFFQSAWFGIMAMVLVGSSWCLIGYIMGDAPKRGIEPGLVQFFGAVFSASVSLGIILATDSIPRCSLKVSLLTCGALALGGAMNFFMLMIMSFAMQRGPNGIIWAIIQSALVFPFLGGIVFFGVAVTWYRLLGLVLLLAALGFFAAGKDNSTRSSGWKIPAFICLAICAVQQNLSTAPAYFEEARAVNSIVRTFSASGGGLIAAILYLFFRNTPDRRTFSIASLRNVTLWKYIGGLQFFHLFFAYTLFYPGMNAMADHGLGGMCYPMMVGSCIITFTLLSILILKERFRFVQGFGLGLCVLGLAMLCCPQPDRRSGDDAVRPKNAEVVQASTPDDTVAVPD